MTFCYNVENAVQYSASINLLEVAKAGMVFLKYKEKQCCGNAKMNRGIFGAGR